MPLGDEPRGEHKYTRTASLERVREALENALDANGTINGYPKVKDNIDKALETLNRLMGDAE